MVVLEELEHARARGATIIAEIVGFGQTADAYHITAPSEGGEGAVRAMKLALKEPAPTRPRSTTSTRTAPPPPPTTSNESAAISTLLGGRAKEVIVGSTKSMTGHTLGAAGAIEGVICALACQEGKIPPTINYTTPDPACDLNYGTDGVTERAVGLALSNSFGFGGHNVCLAIRRFDG
jgi:3-oxoacyl-[acyl-carrier-protein] synthase II